jgi:hypothetical protein
MQWKEFVAKYPDEGNPGQDEAALVARHTEQSDRATELMKGDPNLNFLAAFIIAGDELANERSQRWVRMGLDPELAMGFVGSYARLAFALWAVSQGHMDKATLLDVLPGLWRGSDPDDTDPRFLDLWREAHALHGGTILDNEDQPLPIHTDTFGDPWLVLYRGQLDLNGEGIAWTTDYAIARKFSTTGGLRATQRVGHVLARWAHPKDALAYLTGRGESEVVIDPNDLFDTEPTWPMP